MRDMELEDSELKPFLDASQLEKWWQGILDLATSDHKEDVAEETEEGGRVQDAEQRYYEIEEEIEVKERKNAKALLKSPHFRPKARINGSAHLGKSRSQ